MPNVMASFFQRRKVNPTTPVAPKRVEDMPIGNEEENKQEEYPGNMPSLSQLPQAPFPEQVPAPAPIVTPEATPQINVGDTTARDAARRALRLGFATPEDVSGVLPVEEMGNPDIKQNEATNPISKAPYFTEADLTPEAAPQQNLVAERMRSKIEESTPNIVNKLNQAPIENNIVRNNIMSRQQTPAGYNESSYNPQYTSEVIAQEEAVPPMPQIEEAQAAPVSPQMAELNQLMQQMGYGTYAEQKKQQSDMLARSEGMEPTDADRRLQYGLGAIGDVGRASTEYLQAAGTSPFGKPDLGRIAKGYENYGAGTEKVIAEKQKMADQLRARAAKITTEPMEAVQGMYKTLGAPDELNKIRVGNVETQAKTGLTNATTAKTVEDVKQEILDNDPKSPNSANFRNFVAEVFPSYSNSVKGMSKKSILAVMPALRDLENNYAKAKEQKATDKPLTLSSPLDGREFVTLKGKSEVEAAKLGTKLNAATEMGKELKELKAALPKGGVSFQQQMGTDAAGIKINAILGNIALIAKNYYGFGAAFTGTEVASTFNAIGYNIYSVDNGIATLDKNLLRTALNDPKAVKAMGEAIEKYSNKLKSQLKGELNMSSLPGSSEAIEKELNTLIPSNVEPPKAVPGTPWRGTGNVSTATSTSTQTSSSKRPILKFKP